jgi:hypothetical protein
LPAGAATPERLALIVADDREGRVFLIGRQVDRHRLERREPLGDFLRRERFIDTHLAGRHQDVLLSVEFRVDPLALAQRDGGAGDEHRADHTDRGGKYDGVGALTKPRHDVASV